MILTLLAAVVASCATVTVSTATPADIPALEADAACFGQREAEATADKTDAEKRRISARSSRILREKKVIELEALPPPKPVIVAEGDSITAPAYSWASLHAAKHPDHTFVNLAVGGSDIRMMTARIDAVLAKRPAEVWLLIGANNMPDAKAFLVDLWAYVDRVRATGAKVYVGTILPQKDRPEREAQRAIANAGIIADAAKHGATVIRFDADTRYGDHADASDPALFGDGVHPGTALHKDMESGAMAGAHDPAPPGFVPSPTLDGGAPWTAPFEISYGLAPAGLPNIYDSNKGAFRFVCGGKGRLVHDDPVLYPGKPGASHLHQPWGNADFSAFTTPESLRQSAVTDCNDTPFSLNRSLYWQPALVNDQGQAIQPDLVVVYYKQWASDSPPCTPGSPTFVGRCVTIPNQIRFIFGWNPKAPDAPVKGASWYCTAAAGLADRQRGGHFANLADVFAAGCRAGDTLTANTLGPNCWDGKHLDTPDHRSHVAYAEHRADGRYTCPVTHPFTIPQEENKAQWTVTADMIADDGTPRIGLSSDMMKAGAKPGETLHADYMEAWDERTKAMWFDNCIQKRLSCNGGNLGNGFKLIGAEKPPYGWVNPAPRVALPNALHHVP